MPTVTDFRASLSGADPIVGQQLVSSGWYVDKLTGQYYYYDAVQNQWYIYAAGYLYALAAYMNPAPKQVQLTPGEKLKISLSFKYMGPAVTGVSSRYVIGVYGAAGFTEKLYIAPTFNIAANLTGTPMTVTQEATLTIPSDVGADWDDIYVKIWGGSPSIGGSELSPNYIFGYENALKIVGIEANITEFKILDFVKV